METFRQVCLVALIGVVGCSGRTVARYSSSARADGGYLLTLDTSGHCEIRANRGGAEFESSGRYWLEGDRCILETRPRAQSVVQAALAWRTPVERSTNWIVRTNGAEYLVSAHRYTAFKETGNTNLLRDQLRKVQQGE